MYSKYLRLLAITAVTIIVTLSMVTSAGAAYRQRFISYLDPGSTAPGDSGSPNGHWNDLLGAPNMAVGQSVWIAVDNIQVLTNTKQWWVEVAVPPAGGTFSASGWTGYLNGGTGQSVTTLVSSQVVPGTPFKQRWNFQSIPQPDWEVVKITRTAKGGLEDSVSVSFDGNSACRTTRGAITEGQVVTIPGLTQGDSTTGPVITQVFLYHTASALDVSVVPTFTGPPGSGNWSHVFLSVDEEGNPAPQGVILWTTDGPGVEPGGVFDVTFTMEGPVEGRYAVATFNQNDGTYNRVEIPASSDIPTLTEWGMIIFCVLLFGWMAWMVVRRKRSVTVGI